jgi:ABC-type multidrug transport system fused ATPase/permease subunit
MWTAAPVIWLSFAGYGYWIASIKRRNPGEGAILGLLLGPIGCVLEATFRERTSEEIDQERERRQQEAQERLQEQRQLQADLQAEAAKRRKEAEARAEIARIRREKQSARFSAWFDRAILKFGWYKALPEVVQPIVLGLLFSLPLVGLLILLLRGLR